MTEETRITLTGWQGELLEDQSEFLCIIGGRGAAKTRFAALKAHRWIEQYPMVEFGYAANDFSTFEANFVNEIQKGLFPEIGWLEGREFRYIGGKKLWKFYNGATLRGFTMDKKPTKGPTLGGVIGDEVDQWPSEDHWDVFQACARDARGPRQRIVLANAMPPTFWLNVHFEGSADGTIKARAGHTIRRVSSYENPFLPEDEIRKLETVYPPGSLAYRRWVLGEAVAMQGALWPEFDIERHVFAPAAAPTRVLGANGLDLGHRPDPYAFVVARVDAQRRIWIIREHQQAELSALQQAPILKAMYESGEIYSDHDASERATLRELGIHTTLAQKSIPTGVETVRQAIIQDRLMISEECPLTIAAVQNSTWAGNPSGGREKPKHDQYSHLASAVRYLVVGVHGLSRTIEPRGRKILY